MPNFRNVLREAKKRKIAQQHNGFILTERTEQENPPEKVLSSTISPLRKLGYAMLGCMVIAVGIYSLGIATASLALTTGAIMAGMLRYRKRLFEQTEKVIENEKGDHSPHQAGNSDNAYQHGYVAGNSWSAYAQSYTRLEDWKHPLRFGAGMVHANREKQSENFSEQVRTAQNRKVK